MKEPCKIHTEISIQSKLEKVFESLAVDGKQFPNYFKGFFPLIPPIIEITIPPNSKVEIGIIRTVKLGDGSIVKERILEHNNPYSQTYDMAEMNSIQKILFTNMQGKYSLRESNGIIAVNWDYAFFPKDNFLSFLLVPLVVWAFKKAMNRCLKKVKVFHESGV